LWLVFGYCGVGFGLLRGLFRGSGAGSVIF
jgi:hypothetical protein